MQSMVVYAAENGDLFPLVRIPDDGQGTTYELAQTQNNDSTLSQTGTTADNALADYYNNQKLFQKSIPACMWILVLKGQVAPKGFLCKSDPVISSPAQQQSGAYYYINFNSTSGSPDNTYSYSLTIPWSYNHNGQSGVGAWWKNTSDSSMPLMSDIAPLNGSGTNPVANLVGQPNGGVPSGGPKSWNSANHLRDGQNVGFADAHAEFTRRPDVGPSSDNIFTCWSDISGNYNQGIPPTTSRQIPPLQTGSGSGGGMTSPYDFIMVPVANVSDGSRQ
jgi:hypothetical protein